VRPAAGRVLLLAVILALLAACDPAGPAAPASAGVIVQVKADGDAEMMLLLPADRKGLDPLQLGNQVSKAIFPPLRLPGESGWMTKAALGSRWSACVSRAPTPPVGGRGWTLTWAGLSGHFTAQA